MKLDFFSSTQWLRNAALWATVVTAALPAQAQYKVTGPDGKVTFTDRPALTSDGKVSTISAKSGSSDVPLPPALQRVATRYPVSLYVVTSACEPCDSGRLLLRQRGIPFSERQVQSAEDVEALERLTGSRDTPALTIGSQALRGLTSDTWNAYLDAAGYPRQSQLPASYTYAAPEPLSAKPTLQAPTPATPTRADAPTPSITENNPAGIKF
jgi:glutaredoxin